MNFPLCPRSSAGRGWLGLLAALHLAGTAFALDLEGTQKLLSTGEYEQAAREAAAASLGDPRPEEWALVEAEALRALGRYADARAVLEAALVRAPMSIRLRLAAYEVLRLAGDPDQANALFTEVEQLVARREWGYRSPADRIALGRAALLAGADPKSVLERFFDPVQKARPEFRESYLAGGELALEKNDFALAAKLFGAAAKKFPEDAEFAFGLARAFAPSDSEATAGALERTLKLNPNHVGAHLLVAESAINSEHYAEAGAALAKALTVNPVSWEAQALHAVLAHLRADPAAEKKAREAALNPWSTNPEVDSLIGRKLSQKYRFAEGAERQRAALQLDPEFLLAKMQLAQDLLRLGEDDEGWRLVEEVQKADPYDVVAYNLTTLRDRLAKFQTLESENFLLRMDPKEAAIYGQEALALLERAHATLTKKYGLEPKQRTIVEIFPEQKDFAIRTFGLPGGDGYLGVCFGRLITANSPASHPRTAANWQAILWHEFCHVVTLTLTKNKMPRWLSEGISVYEERQASGTWGEQMKPRYRAMILGEDLTPVSALSGAFLQPKTPAHLGFAYYESSLVVEYFVERFGIAKLQRILADLARGVEINAAIAAHALPIEQIDAEFAARAQGLARAVGPALDWAKPTPQDLVNDAAATNNFTLLTKQARQFLKARDWGAAKAPLKKLIELYPEQQGDESAYALLAKAHRELGESAEELAALNQLAERSPDALEAFARLMELAAERQDWPAVERNAALYLAVNPLHVLPHRRAAEASEALGNKPAAIAEYRAVLKLDPPNPAEMHFRLGRLLHETGDADAKREVLLALEEAPRFRDALQLLLKINAP